MQQLEVLLRANAIAAGNDDGRVLDVHLRLLDVAADDLHHEVLVLDILLGVELHDGALVVGVVDLLLHHALADSRHLRTVVGIHDRGHDVAAESGADLIEQVGVILARLHVRVVADFEGRTVGGQTRVQARRNARAQVAADARGAHQTNLRLNLAEEIDEHGGMGVRRVGIETLVLNFVDNVGTVLVKLLFDAVQLVAQDDGLELHTQLVGQSTALGEQLQAHVGDVAILILTVYYKIVTVFFSHNILLYCSVFSG